MTRLYKGKLLLRIFFITILSCACILQDKSEDSDHIDKILRLDLFPSVYYHGSFHSYEEFRNKHDYISVVLLTKGCIPCENKIVEWQLNNNKIKGIEKYTILLIFQGYNLDEIDRLKTSFNFDYAFVIDTHFRYLNYNKDIPFWVLDSSILIDAENKIKQIGNPFGTVSKLKQFKSIVNNEME